MLESQLLCPGWRTFYKHFRLKTTGAFTATCSPHQESTSVNWINLRKITFVILAGAFGAEIPLTSARPGCAWPVLLRASCWSWGHWADVATGLCWEPAPAACVARICDSPALPRSLCGDPTSKQAHGMGISCFPEGFVSCRISHLDVQPLWGCRWLGCTWRMMVYSIEGKKKDGVRGLKTSSKNIRISLPQLSHLSHGKDTMKAAE